MMIEDNEDFTPGKSVQELAREIVLEHLSGIEWLTVVEYVDDEMVGASVSQEFYEEVEEAVGDILNELARSVGA